MGALPIVLALAVLILGIWYSHTQRRKGKMPPFHTLRGQALSFTREQLGFTKPSPDHPVWGALMEMGYPHGSATLACFIDGSASIYFSGGGGVIGGHVHETIRKAAIAFVTAAGEHVQQLPLTKDFPLPKAEQTLFYLHTDAGIHMANASEEELGEGKHALSPLFFAAHQVITELRLTSQESQRS